MRFSRFLLSAALIAAPVALSISSADAQDAAPAPAAVANSGAAATFDETLFNVPDGKDAKFYQERLNALQEAFQKYYQATGGDQAKINALIPKLQVAAKTIFKNLVDAKDVPAAEAFQYFQSYAASFAQEGDLDGLNALLAKEQAKTPVDSERVKFLNYIIVSVSLDKALAANDDAAIAKIGGEIIAKANVDDDWMQSAPALLSGVARMNPKVGTRLLNDLCASFAASKDENRKQIAASLAGQLRFLNLVGNEMKVEGLYLDGTEIDWKSYRGKVVLIDFWATWCGPCVGEIPNMTKMYEKYNAAGFEILGYSLDQDLDALHKFEEERKLPWKTASQKLSLDSKAKKYVDLSEYYGITGIPTMILVGKDGKVLSTNARGPELERLLKAQFPNVK
ncbi:MAG: TlpA family protein disulfide reductase [Thermoguttaceae bacterium]|nr:TlpA family protein disulfide reductase [Thermoguttaceae bacterium]MBQ7111764.1 TlpA family protein disulfide reductase [Thermoguttaceae bacterium]